MLFAAIKPYLLWIKIGAAVIALGIAFAAGARFEAVSWQKRFIDEQQAANEARDLAAQRNAALLKAQVEASQQLDAALAQQQTRLATEQADKLRRIHAYYAKNFTANVAIDARVERLWRETNDEASTGGMPETAPTASGGDAATGGCALSDLHANHAELVTRYKRMTLRLVRLQEWAQQAMEVCGG